MVLFALVEPSTVKKGFQETHHHANCDRNGNELSNPRTMKMVTSIAWRQQKNWREKSDPFFANSIIACTKRQNKALQRLIEGLNLIILSLVFGKHLHVLLIGTSKLEVKRDIQLQERK